MFAPSKSMLLLLGIYAAVVAVNADENVNSDQLEVKVYYEALCPGSMRFFKRQLYPSMIDKNRLPFTDLKLIPYGKVIKTKNAKTNETELSCQHGPDECELNALHACIIETSDVLNSLILINCLMKSFSHIDECASRNNISVVNAKSCKASRSTVEILSKYGQETSKIDLLFVPSIGIDNTFNNDDQNQLRKNFDRVFCRTFSNKFNYTLGGCPKLMKSRQNC